MHGRIGTCLRPVEPPSVDEHGPTPQAPLARGDADLRRAWVVAIVAGVIAGAIALLAWAGGGRASAHEGAAVGVPADPVTPDEPGSISVPPPPFKTDEALDSLDSTGKPCSGCHNDELEPNPERRALDTHDGIVLHHDEEHRWCLDCHDKDNRDKLRLASGALIDFTESYRLCGQCHGDKYRDWRWGIHGRRTGYWNDAKGAREYLLCVHCHDSHSPRYKPIAPKPPPTRPEELR